VLLEDVNSDPDFLEAMSGIASEVCVPLFDRELVVGALNIESSREMKLTETDLLLLTGLGESISIAIERARLVDELRKANDHLQTHLVEIQILQTELREQAIRDPLTGLFNRRYLQETLEREIARAKREGAPVSIIVMDLDHFKQVNDTYGHKAGDVLLSAFGKLLQTILRAEDVICRFGGEEFVILMPGAPLEAARQRAESIRMGIETLRVLDGERELHATASLGVAAYPVHGPNGEEVQIRADRALYLAKQTGRNRVVVYEDPKMTVQSDAGGYDDQK
jgi:diguanylate cyclase (GGDEF)-like protein